MTFRLCLQLAEGDFTAEGNAPAGAASDRRQAGEGSQKSRAGTRSSFQQAGQVRVIGQTRTRVAGGVAGAGVVLPPHLGAPV